LSEGLIENPASHSLSITDQEMWKMACTHTQCLGHMVLVTSN